MLILFPPSEGKAVAGSSCAPVELGDLSFPVLTEARESVLGVLADVSAAEDALEVLKVGPSLVAEVERNRRLLEEPAQEAAQVYTGVLFEAFGATSLGAEARARADESVLVVSALWGAVRLGDAVPAYRLSMGVKLGELGDLGKFWAGELPAALDSYAGEQLVVDCRSAAYAKAWKPAPSRHLVVRVERVLEDGSRKVVSHMAKHYRGLLGRYLVEQGLTDLDDAVELAQALGRDFEVELVEPTAKKPGTLTLVVKD